MMRTIYVDSNFKCHVVDDGTMTAVETNYFDGKSDAYIVGYCYDIENGAIYPWTDADELDNAQREHERQLLEEYAEALTVVGVET